MEALEIIRPMQAKSTSSTHSDHNALAVADRGLRFQRTTLHSALFIAIGMGPVFPTGCAATAASAAHLGATVGVSVKVVSSAIAHSEYQARQLLIAPVDIVRGYVDAPGATRFSVKTNSRLGYLLVFDSLLDLFDSVQVSGATTSAHLGREGGAIVQRGWHPSDTAQELNFRFFLSAHAVPGNYPWPLQLSVRALD
jgi:hypothetical protein